MNKEGSRKIQTNRELFLAQKLEYLKRTKLFLIIRMDNFRRFLDKVFDESHFFSGI